MQGSWLASWSVPASNGTTTFRLRSVSFAGLAACLLTGGPGEEDRRHRGGGSTESHGPAPHRYYPAALSSLGTDSGQNPAGDVTRGCNSALCDRWVNFSLTLLDFGNLQVTYLYEG